MATAGEKNSQKVYANEVKAKSGKDYYRSDTIDLQELMDNVGRYASISLFLNEKEVNGEIKRSSTLMFNESDAKYLKKPGTGSQAQADPQPAAGGRPAGVRRI